MLETAIFLKEKPLLPEFIKNHKAFKTVQHVKKIFPSIGLSNFSQETDIKNIDVQNHAASLLYRISYILGDADYHFLSREPEKVVRIRRLCSALMTMISHRQKEWIAALEKTGKLSLLADIVEDNGNVFVPVGTSLFKAYNKYREVLSKEYGYHNASPLEQYQEFKDYSATNLSGKINIVFSAEGIDGAWDIATMSQRGITSCQSWSGQFKECLIGSLTDPYTGIIYTTSGSKTSFGPKMIRRCIVRFIVNRMTGEQFIFLDKMYTTLDKATLQAFKNELEKRIPSRIKVLDYYNIPSSNLKDYYIPNNPHTTTLLKFRKDKCSSPNSYNMSGYHNQHNILSYRDTFIEYKEGANLIGLLEGVLQSRINDFKNNCYVYLSDATNLSYEYVTAIESQLAEAIFSDFQLDDDMVPSTLARQICLHYLRNSKSILDKLIISVKEKMKACKHKSTLIEGENSLVVGKSKETTFDDFVKNDLAKFLIQNVLDIWNSTIPKPAPKTIAAKKKGRK